MQRSQLAAKRSEGLGSLAAMAQQVRAAGRNGDTVLAHINRQEADLLDKLADGVIDYPVNRETGLPSFGMTDSESGGFGGSSGEDSNPGGVGGGPTGGQTGGGIGGNTEGGQGGLDGGYNGAGLGDRGAPSSGANVIGNPEMGGGLARSLGLASVAALGPMGRNVNAASSVMAGQPVSWSDRFSDFTGQGAPGDVLGSRAATLGATMIGGALLGPVGASLAGLAHSTALGGKSLGMAAPEAIGGYFGGALGSLAGHEIGNAITGREDYDAPMTQADRDAKDKASIESARNGATGGATATASAGAGTGASEGAGAGTNYVMAPPEAAPAGSATATARAGDWDEDGFLSRNPEVAEAVSNGTWASGRAFDLAYRAQAGASYDAAKAIGVVGAYNSDNLKARPGQAVPYRG